MLVLTRKYQEKVHIGDGITITVLRTKGKAVRLGIEAPAHVPVIRGELTFDRSPTSDIDDLGDATADKESASKSGHGQERSRPPRGRAVWRSERQTTPQVTLQRLPRDKAAQIMPQLLTGNAPLRDMLQQRSKAV